MFDIDKFKNVNDTYGHGIGDIVLKETATTVMDNIRVNDHLFRIGGDEFLILLPNTELEYAALVAKKLRKIAENNEYADTKIKNITFSMGVAQYNADESVEEFVARADITMYGAKETGGNKVVSG
ncbi:MAG: GGDEF domain-containing protein [Bacillota bacterium]|nr:GGDEF domain-containing protein [Bacillota bacterium]